MDGCQRRESLRCGKMSEQRFKLHIEWSNIDKTDGIAELSDNGQPLLETDCIEDARLLQTILNELNDENKKLRQEKERWIKKTDKLEQYIDSLFFGNTHICKHLDVEMVKFWCDKEQKYHLPQCKYKDCFKKENLVKTADEVLRSVE